MADLAENCSDRRPDVLFLTELLGHAKHISSLLRSYGYSSQYNPTDYLPPHPPDLPEAKIPASACSDPLGCLIAYRNDTPWANLVRKLPGQPKGLAFHLATLLISPPRSAPLLLISTYLPDCTSLAASSTICAAAAQIVDRHLGALAILGGDLHAN